MAQTYGPLAAQRDSGGRVVYTEAVHHERNP